MKDYKRILQGVVNIINITKKSDIGFANICTYIGENCPELAESEDKKIRKEIIAHIKWCEDSGYCAKEEMTRWITFLEKQGEQKPQGKSALEAAKEEKVDNQNCVKPADKIELKFKVGDKIQFSKGCGTIMTIEKIENGEYIFANNLGHTTIEDGNKWYLVERNHTWSEEDEKMALSIEQVMNCASLLNIVPDKVDKIRTWLKSLKNKVQSKQEWNEEDKDILNTIINHFEIDLECTENDDIIRWLKSLRPQNKWKPSDEQIHAFEQVYDWYNNNFAPNETLTSLYNDLKKLKE